MAENKNIENTRIIEDSDLNNVSGGLVHRIIKMRQMILLQF